MKDSATPVKSMLDMLVLKALSSGPMHGFGVALWLESRSDGSLGLDDSMTYQVLHRLEARELIVADWTVTENKRRARVYRLTRKGRTALAQQTDAWLEYSRSVTSIMLGDAKPRST
jgi:PadR family transcriptional regulator PadR